MLGELLGCHGGRRLIPSGVSVLVHFLQFFFETLAKEDVQRRGDCVLAEVSCGVALVDCEVLARGGVGVEEEALHGVFGLFLRAPGVAEVSPVRHLRTEAKGEAVGAEGGWAFAFIVGERAAVHFFVYFHGVLVSG